MARQCEVCGKGVKTSMQVSHSHSRSKRKLVPNIQKVKAVVDGSHQTLKVCTRCLRSGKVKRSI